MNNIEIVLTACIGALSTGIGILAMIFAKKSHVAQLGQSIEDMKERLARQEKRHVDEVKELKEEFERKRVEDKKDFRNDINEIKSGIKNIEKMIIKSAVKKGGK